MARWAAMVLGVLVLAHVSAAQFTQQGTKLVGTAAVGPSPRQGNAVAISADGGTAIVGAPGDSSATGAAWVFVRNDGTWSQLGTKLVGSGATGTPEFGWSVAISADGSTAIVGGPSDNSYAGAAWVFTRHSGVWSPQGAKLVGADAVGAAQQGVSVAISADGNTAIVGGEQDNSFIGAAWVYTRSEGVWSQQGAKLTGFDAVGAAYQGSSVAISADGNTAVVGGSQDNFNLGAAWVFTRTGGAWSQQGTKLFGTAPIGADVFEGTSVALSADGNTAFVGGVGDYFNAGAAWVFTRSGGVWSQQGSKLAGTGAAGNAQQGWSVAVSADGGTAIVGAPLDSNSSGAAWVFTRRGSVWSQQGSKLVGTGAAGLAQQGTAVAITADGATALVGGPADYWAGATWAFVTPACAPSISVQPRGRIIASGETATLSAAASGTAPLTYQWYEGASGDTSQPVGTNVPTFKTTALTTAASYWLRVSNSCGHADSPTATVTVGERARRHLP